MVTRILFDPRRDIPNATAPLPVSLDATPTHLREDGAIVIIPSTITFIVNTAADLVQLTPPAPSFAWRLTVRQNGDIKQERTVRFPDIASITWQDLTDVDPASLGETTGHARQWDATFWELTTLIANLNTGGGGGGGGAGGQQVVFATAVSVWSMTHSLGRRPIVELYRLDGTRIFTDVTATTTTATATYPAPQTGYAILN